ncbi:MAG: beta-propeller domain-containing protein [Bifidobacteriaceae bacterium]|jgi:uncharacterized secreted protein with C-terminal beta-propeller domain|nr:beta-propeller domain-containing protein [Bifidobacteriaceae bacterium]
MTDPIFRDMRQQFTPPPELVDRLRGRLAADDAAASGDGAPTAHAVPGRSPGLNQHQAANQHQAKRRARRAAGRGAGPAHRADFARPPRRVSVPLLSGAALAVLVLAGTVVYATVKGPRLTAEPLPAPTAQAEDLVSSPADYAAVYAALEGVWQSGDLQGYGFLAKAESGGMPAAESGDSAAQGQAELAYTDDSSAYTGTNVQVAGIDEGDLVKTDGEHIFVASLSNLPSDPYSDPYSDSDSDSYSYSDSYSAELADISVVKPDGEGTRVVARIDVASQFGDGQALKPPNSLVIADLMLFNDVLAVVAHHNQATIADPAEDPAEDPAQDPAPGANLSPEEQLKLLYDGPTIFKTAVLLYDVSNAEQPRLLTKLEQDGSYRTSRLLDGKLHVISDHWIQDRDSTDPDDPATFAPSIAADGDSQVIAPADLVIWDPPTGTEYVVISAIDLASQQRVAQKAILGGVDTLYMSFDNIYLAHTRWQDQPNLLGRLGLALEGYLATDADSSAAQAVFTDLIRVRLAGSDFEVAAQGSVPGTLVDQFAMDEHESNLRVATTVWPTDSSEAVSSLHVLGPDLAVIGQIEELMRDESIQSVRFDGEVGYVVTFRQTDPLFTIDLADPANPKVMSALKIEGFSAYLHPWGEDRLIGIGYAGDADGLTDGMQLVLFDVSDPFDVSVAASLAVPYDDADALWDHRGFLADPTNSLIGFQVRDWGMPTGTPGQAFAFFSVSGDGFEQRFSVALPDDWYATRGLRVGSDFYVISSSGLRVLDGDSFAQLAELDLAS